MDDNNKSEEISWHQNSAEVIDHTCDDNRNIVLNIEEKADVISIQSINVTNDISMNYYDNLSTDIMHHFYHQIIMKMCLLDQKIIQQNK